ncbi:hypothetical protein AJ80_07530 [Polytolypa hystricis UAMH7299]|uniref:Uncharacterized protein n=1 Tax=Polytolypa hystricis (strain UAMH7299) TaxID=1447883 RepID=A0A2B7XMV9_POLH7|nr:hypothetical protein AJ80_07530 [Polytolypa hystricis UAMH7299]
MPGSNPFRPRKPATAPQPEVVQPRKDDGGTAVFSADTAASAGHDEDAHRYERVLGDSDRPHIFPSHSSQQPNTSNIASPASSPSLSRNDRDRSVDTSVRFHTYSAHRGSPPPPSRDYQSSSSDDESPLDPFNPDASGSENEDVGDETNVDIRIAATGRENDRRSLSGSRGVRGVELTASFPGLQRSKSHGADNRSNSSATASANKKTTLDVDAFKRLLLTGDTGIGAQQLSSIPPQVGPISDSSSTTDTASISKQPIFENHRHLQTETPRTSHDMTTSEADEERRKLSGQSAPTEKKKPPPPKTRHGKPIPAAKASSPSLPSPTSYPPLGNRSTSSNSIPSPPPTHQETAQASTHTQGPVADFPRPTTGKHAHERTNSIPTGSTQFKRPPTPPLTRRFSQMRSGNSGLSRSNSARVSLSPKSNLSASFSHGPSGPKTPPAPPSRRSDREIPMPSPSDLASDGKLPFPQDSGSRQLGNLAEIDNLNKLTIFPTELGSLASTKRLSRNSSTRSSTTTANVPPKPPPPRRMGGSSSSRASLDEPRPTMTMSPELINSEEQTPRFSGSPAPMIPSTANDILADLTRLQREVDELRGQYESRKSSR